MLPTTFPYEDTQDPEAFSLGSSHQARSTAEATIAACEHRRRRLPLHLWRVLCGGGGGAVATRPACAAPRVLHGIAHRSYIFCATRCHPAMKRYDGSSRVNDFYKFSFKEPSELSHQALSPKSSALSAECERSVLWHKACASRRIPELTSQL